MSKAYVSFENRLFQGFVVPPEIRDEFLQLIQWHDLPNEPRFLRFFILLLSNNYNRSVMDYFKTVSAETFHRIFEVGGSYEISCPNPFETVNNDIVGTFLDPISMCFDSSTDGMFRYESIFEYVVQLKYVKLNDYLRVFLVCDALYYKGCTLNYATHFIDFLDVLRNESFTGYDRPRELGGFFYLFAYCLILQERVDELYPYAASLFLIYSGKKLRYSLAGLKHQMFLYRKNFRVDMELPELFTELERVHMTNELDVYDMMEYLCGGRYHADREQLLKDGLIVSRLGNLFLAAKSSNSGSIPEPCNRLTGYGEREFGCFKPIVDGRFTDSVKIPCDRYGRLPGQAFRNPFGENPFNRQ